jgi:hypothetical protein
MDLLHDVLSPDNQKMRVVALVWMQERNNERHGEDRKETMKDMANTDTLLEFQFVVTRQE